MHWADRKHFTANAFMILVIVVLITMQACSCKASMMKMRGKDIAYTKWVAKDHQHIMLVQLLNGITEQASRFSPVMVALGAVKKIIGTMAAFMKEHLPSRDLVL